MKGFMALFCVSILLFFGIRADGIAFVKYSEKGSSKDAAQASKFKPKALNCVFVLIKDEKQAEKAYEDAKSVYKTLNAALGVTKDDKSNKVDDGKTKEKEDPNKSEDKKESNETPKKGTGRILMTSINNNEYQEYLAKSEAYQYGFEPRAMADNEANKDTEKKEEKKEDEAQKGKEEEKEKGENKEQDKSDKKPEGKMSVAIVCNYPTQEGKSPSSFERKHVCNGNKVSIKYKKTLTRVEDAVTTSQELVAGDTSATYLAVEELAEKAENKVEYNEKDCILTVSFSGILSAAIGIMMIIANMY